jgi:hypothetical protein
MLYGRCQGFASRFHGRENFDLIDQLGGTAFIAFKENATGKVGGTFEQMFNYYEYKQEEFLAHYHKLSKWSQRSA